MNSVLGHSASSASQASTTPPAIPPAIARIIESLHTQDNRITANPLFAVQQRRRIYGLDADYRDGVVWVDDEGNETDADVADSRELGYVDRWEFVTGCFTEQGCKDFIACNGHNLNEPRIYAYGSYRNAEWAALRDWLMSLRGQRAVEGSPESKGRITPDAPASPAPPQGEREAAFQRGKRAGYSEGFLAGRASLRASPAVPVAQDDTRVDAYDQIDRFLRNNMDDESYAHYSQALDLVWLTPPADNKENGK